MRSLLAAVSLLALIVFVAPVSATVIDNKVPIPELVGGADIIVMGKVTKIQPEPILALPTAKATRKEHYQLLEIKVEEALLGAKDVKTLKVAVQCGTIQVGGRVKYVPITPVNEGQDGCLFLRRHFSGNFSLLESGCLLASDGNADFKKDMELTKKCVQLIAEPNEGLNSTEAKDRYLTAALLIRKYRGLQQPFFFTPEKKEIKEKPIEAEQSRMILKALAEAEWKADENATAISPMNLFQRLGLTAKDGWKFKQQPANAFDAKAVIRFRTQFAAAAKEWLKENGETYRIKRIVGDDDGKTKESKKEP